MSDRGGKTPCYVGKRPCGCVVAAVVDDGDDPKDVAKFIADLVKRGMTVDRSTVDEARKLLTEGLKCEHQPAKSASERERFMRKTATPFLPGFDEEKAR